MKQEKINEITRKATERPLEFTHSVIEQSKKLRTPSAKVDKIGTTIGGIASIGLLLSGAVQIFVGKPLWAVGTLSAGAVALVSNRIHHHNIKDKNQKV